MSPLGFSAARSVSLVWSGTSTLALLAWVSYSAPMVGRSHLMARSALAEAGSVAAVTGTTAEMSEQLVQRRATLGLSYILVSDEFMDLFAPVAERITGT